MGGFKINSIGIVICTRSNSKRIFQKPFCLINNKQAIRILLDYIKDIPQDICLAIPPEDKENYSKIYRDYPKLKWFYGFENNPLARMYHAAMRFNYKYVVRITHDDLLIDANDLQNHIKFHMHHKLDYSYNAKIINGAGVEIIKTELLEKAWDHNKKINIEHISYFVKAESALTKEYISDKSLCRDYRLTLDYPQDRDILDILFRRLGHGVKLYKLVEFLDNNKILLNINRLPQVTVYTCNYNCEKYIHNTIRSVLFQNASFDYEYILLDDYSTDNSIIEIAEYLGQPKITNFICNNSNLGLASSSNKCLSEARGKYFIRIDADDYFIHNNALQKLYNFMESNPDKAVCYPDYYFGNIGTHKKGSESNHPGGAMFRTKILNEIKFKDNLKCLDGYDLYNRISKRFKMGYLSEPIFFYTKRLDGLSNHKEKLEIKKQLDALNLESLV